VREIRNLTPPPSHLSLHMSWKDRTSEFSQIVGKKLKKPLEAPFPSPKTQFTQIASNLGFQIHETAKKIGKSNQDGQKSSSL